MQTPIPLTAGKWTRWWTTTHYWRGGVHSDGIYRVRRLLYVAKADYGGRPPSGKRLNLDDREYRVVQADDAAGMLTIEIEANRT